MKDGQCRITTNSQVCQLALVGYFKRGQLVVAGQQCSDVGHVVHARQTGDGAVLAVQLGDGRAMDQAGDGCQVGVLEAKQFFQGITASHVERSQVVSIAVERGQ